MSAPLMRSVTSVLVMRNSFGQNYSKGVELSAAEISRIMPPHTEYRLITSDAYRATTRDGSVSTLALSECEKMLGPPASSGNCGHSHSVFVGGDHLTSMCSVLASLKVYGNNFKLLWMDAHADIHNEKTSPSKNKHGMVVNMLLNHKYAGIPRLHPSQVMYIGLRRTEPQEDAFIKKWKIRAVTAADIRKSETSSYRKIADFVLNSNAHVSLDVDVLDPSEMKATATPAINGLHLNQLLAIMGIVNSSARNYYATDVMEYNPRKFMGDSSSAAIARDAMRAIFGFLI